MNQFDLLAFERQARKFVKYVHSVDKNELPLNFVEGEGCLVKEEGYKARIPVEARRILDLDSWNVESIGNGIIKNRMFRVMGLTSNLVNFNSVIDFRNHFEPDKPEYDPESERVIYEIYKGRDDKASFEYAKKVFGGRYPLLAYLFFIKDETRYLPTSPKNFDRCFAQMNIDFKMAFNCSWDNYSDYCGIIKEVGSLMPQYMNIAHDVRLLDAHSFVWIVGEKNYMNWNESEADINTPLVPRFISEETGITKYQCARCDHMFKRARRCPECGQLIKIVD